MHLDTHCSIADELSVVTRSDLHDACSQCASVAVCLVAGGGGGGVGLTPGRTPLRDQLGLNDPDAVAAENRRAEKVSFMHACMPADAFKPQLLAGNMASSVSNSKA